MLCLNVSSVIFSVKRQSSVVWNNSPKQQSCDYLNELNKMKFRLARHAGLISGAHQHLWLVVSTLVWAAQALNISIIAESSVVQHWSRRQCCWCLRILLQLCLPLPDFVREESSRLSFHSPKGLFLKLQAHSKWCTEFSSFLITGNCFPDKISYFSSCL